MWYSGQQPPRGGSRTSGSLSTGAVDSAGHTHICSSSSKLSFGRPARLVNDRLSSSFYFVVFFFLRSNGPAGNRAKCVAVQKIDGRADGLRKSQTHSYFNYISVKEVSQTDQ